MKLLIAVDSAISTEVLVGAVGVRPWPDGTTAHVLSVVVDAEVPLEVWREFGYVKDAVRREMEGTGEQITSLAVERLKEVGGLREGDADVGTIDRLLEPGGVACIQTILVPDERWDRYRKTPDWIERYVFPGCLIPSLDALSRALAGSELELRDVDEIGPHYAETLRRWRASFHERIAEVRELGHGPRFERTWDFYLAFCEAAFRTGTLRDAQLTLARAEA